MGVILPRRYFLSYFLKNVKMCEDWHYMRKTFVEVLQLYEIWRRFIIANQKKKKVFCSHNTFPYWNLQSKPKRNRKSQDRAKLSQPRIATSTIKFPLDRLLLNATEHPKKFGVLALGQPCLVRVPEWPDGKVEVLSCESLARPSCLMLCCVWLNCNPGVVVWGVHRGWWGWCFPFDLIDYWPTDLAGTVCSRVRSGLEKISSFQSEPLGWKTHPTPDLR